MADRYGRAAEPEKRRTPPLHAQLAAAKRQLVEFMRRLGIIPAGVPDDQVELQCDHNPALILRDVDPQTRHHIPHQHDPKGLEWLYRPPHDVKTRGAGATTAGSDVGKAKKLRRLVKARQARAQAETPPAALKADPDPILAPEKGRVKLKAKIQSLGFKPAKPQKRASSYKRRGV